MLPIRDNAPRDRRSVVVGLLIALSVGIFALEVLTWQGAGVRFGRWALVPADLMHPALWRDGHPKPPLSLLLSLLPHASAAQLLVNLLYLLVFAEMVEEIYGHLGFACLYVMGGTLAGLTHAAVASASTEPVLGAGGAISSVVGAYLVLHPTRSVTCISFRGYVRAPAWLFVAAWLLLHGSGALKGPEAGGVAWYGHAVAILFGYGATTVLAPAHMRPRPAAAAVFDHFARNQAAPPRRRAIRTRRPEGGDERACRSV